MDFKLLQINQALMCINYFDFRCVYSTHGFVYWYFIYSYLVVSGSKFEQKIIIHLSLCFSGFLAGIDIN